jgi:hypothetical protein
VDSTLCDFFAGGYSGFLVFYKYSTQMNKPVPIVPPCSSMSLKLLKCFKTVGENEKCYSKNYTSEFYGKKVIVFE